MRVLEVAARALEIDGHVEDAAERVVDGRVEDAAELVVGDWLCWCRGDAGKRGGRGDTSGWRWWRSCRGGSMPQRREATEEASSRLAMGVDCTGRLRRRKRGAGLTLVAHREDHGRECGGAASSSTERTPGVSAAARRGVRAKLFRVPAGYCLYEGLPLVESRVVDITAM